MANLSDLDRLCAEAAAAVERCGGIRPAARELALPYGTIYTRLRRFKRKGISPIASGDVHPRAVTELPPEPRTRRFILTCAQSNTHLHGALWTNLLALANHYGARIMVSTYTYNKAAYGVSAIKRGTTPGTNGEPWYDPAIRDYITDENIALAPGLQWCGEVNIIPTAARPLSGFESYTGRRSGIFPHAKFALECVPGLRSDGTKFNYTTGTVTQRNYIMRKEGQKAQFHHGYGALLVEVDKHGNWFCRQLNADSDGTLHDLDLRVADGKIETGHRIEAITWGDIHVSVRNDYSVLRDMVAKLRPKYQFMHDVLDFHSASHHERYNPHARFERYVNGQDDVVAEIKEVAQFLNDAAIHRADCEIVVVDSNHDNALQRWLREADYRVDPKNALFFLQAQTELYKAIADHRYSMYGDRLNFHLVEWAVGQFLPRTVRFLRPDESFVICKNESGGIECGMHGDLGPNGAPGSLRAFAKMGRKSNTGHTHTAGIVDGAYSGGITGPLTQSYNRGPSSWSHSHILTYENGKRAIVTSWSGKWRA